VNTVCVSLGGGGFSSKQSTYLIVLAEVMCGWAVSRVHCVKFVFQLAGPCGRVGRVEG
jgi:hypothetical protein